MDTVAGVRGKSLPPTRGGSEPRFVGTEGCMKRYVRPIVLVLTLVLLPGLLTAAGQEVPRKPAKEDKCPVCGMFVAKFPDWVAQIDFSDGKVVYFDGAKDLFRYYHDLARYEPGKSKSDIAAIFVTEYYNTTAIAAKDAFFALGSDVFGPMGHELVPFATEQDGQEFLKDHKGKRLLRFDEVTDAILKGLD